MSEDTDGYYYRTTQGVTEGPLSKEAFERAQVKGLVKPGFKAWRQKNGAIFQVHVNRKFVVGKIFSCASCGYAMELTMVVTSLGMITWVFTQPKMQEELSHGSRRENYFLMALCLVTVVMTIVSIRTTMGRLASASSKVVSAELPV